MIVIRWRSVDSRRAARLERAEEAPIHARFLLPAFLLFALSCASVWAQTLTEFDLLPTADAQGIAVGPDGSVWFTEAGAGAIGRLTADGIVTEYPLSSSTSQPLAIVAGPDGQLWFTERGNQKVGRMTVDGVVTNEFSLGEVAIDTHTYPGDIASGPDGNLWIAADGWIERMTPSGSVAEFGVNYAGVGSIVAGPDGNLWFPAPSEYGSKICRMTTDGVLAQFGADLADVGDITVGPDGNVWFTEPMRGVIGRITPQGFIVEFTLPSGTTPMSITAAPDGTLWFTEYSRNRIGQVSIGGVLLNEIALPSPDSHATSIVATPTGAIWFTEAPVSRIGRIIPKKPASLRLRAARH